MAVCLLGLGFSGCNKEEQLQEMEPAQRISYPTPQNVVVYEVDPAIMTYFQHYCQKNAGPVTSNYPFAEGIITANAAGKCCGATSYMMAAGCVAKYLDPNTAYAVNGAKLSNLIGAMQTTIDLTKPLIYGRQNDASFLRVEDNFGYYASVSNPASPKVSSDRTLTKNFMQQALANDKFIVAAVNVYGNITIVNDSKFYDPANNPDLNPTGTVTTGANKNYMTDRDESVYGVGGHIIVIVKITVNLSDGTGVVEYIDPLAKPRFDVNGNPLSNRRYVSYTRLLNSMSSNGSSSNYDVISIGQL